MITGEQVKAARALLGWSQMKLADEAGLNASTIVKMETGNGRLSALRGDLGTRRRHKRSAPAIHPRAGPTLERVRRNPRARYYS